VVNFKQFDSCIIRPTLKRLDKLIPGVYSEAAIELLIGTIAKESAGGIHIRQVGGGPARGIYQIEPKTHQSQYKNYLAYRPDLLEFVKSFAPGFCVQGNYIDDVALYCPQYATLIARLKYWRVTEPLPAANDLMGLGQYWDKYYNANPDHGHPHEWVKWYKKARGIPR